MVHEAAHLAQLEPEEAVDIEAGVMHATTATALRGMGSSLWSKSAAALVGWISSSGESSA